MNTLPMSLIRFAFIERVVCAVWTFRPPPQWLLAGTHGVVIGKLELLVALLCHISCSLSLFISCRLGRLGFASWWRASVPAGVTGYYVFNILSSDHF